MRAPGGVKTLETDTADAIQLLSAANPVPGGLDLDAAELAAGRDRVDRLIESGRRRKDRPRRSFVPLAAAAGLAAILILISSAGLLSSGPSGLRLLNAAAAVAAEQATTVAPAGEAYHVTEYWTSGSQRISKQDWWVTGNGSGRFRQYAPALRETIRARFGAGRFPTEYSFYNPVKDPLHIDVSSLPTNPDALLGTLRRALSRSERRDPGIWGASIRMPLGNKLVPEIGLLLAYPLDSPALRSALFTVAGRLPGVSAETRVRDPLGRPGTAISAPSPYIARLSQAAPTQWTRIIFDARTSQILASEVVVHGRVQMASIYSDRRFVRWPRGG